MTDRAARYAALHVVERVQAVGDRSLQLLHAIEQTVSDLATDGELVDTVARVMGGILVALHKQQVKTPIDPEGKLVATLEKCVGAANRLRDTAERGIASAEADDRLTDDDCVAESWRSFGEKVASLNSVASELVQTIRAIDARIARSWFADEMASLREGLAKTQPIQASDPVRALANAVAQQAQDDASDVETWARNLAASIHQR